MTLPSSNVTPPGCDMTPGSTPDCESAFTTKPTLDQQPPARPDDFLEKSSDIAKNLTPTPSPSQIQEEAATVKKIEALSPTPDQQLNSNSSDLCVNSSQTPVPTMKRSLSEEELSQELEYIHHSSKTSPHHEDGEGSPSPFVQVHDGDLSQECKVEEPELFQGRRRHTSTPMGKRHTPTPNQSRSYLKQFCDFLYNRNEEDQSVFDEVSGDEIFDSRDTAPSADDTFDSQDTAPADVTTARINPENSTLELNYQNSLRDLTNLSLSDSDVDEPKEDKEGGDGETDQESEGVIKDYGDMNSDKENISTETQESESNSRSPTNPSQSPHIVPDQDSLVESDSESVTENVATNPKNPDLRDAATGSSLLNTETKSMPDEENPDATSGKPKVIEDDTDHDSDMPDPSLDEQNVPGQENPNKSDITSDGDIPEVSCEETSKVEQENAEKMSDHVAESQNVTDTKGSEVDLGESDDSASEKMAAKSVGRRDVRALSAPPEDTEYDFKMKQFMESLRLMRSTSTSLTESQTGSKLDKPGADINVFSPLTSRTAVHKLRKRRQSAPEAGPSHSRKRRQSAPLAGPSNSKKSFSHDVPTVTATPSDDTRSVTPDAAGEQSQDNDF
eukprot:TRINITY_DN6686_c0_g1_i14.p1 TRINITY_DN6686_c0_g1~~TRINITY_DN6686_c0_g1_i14.p1  ORF type:complete len:667 (-),score=131.69 TRINITY_DN6686_c0_g1_i14:508-2355(-)